MVCFNESWGVNEVSFSQEESDFIEEAYHIAKPLVGDRFVISNDGWESAASDLLTLHHYSETYEGLEATYGTLLEKLENGENPEVIHNERKAYVGGTRYHDEPIFLSEFGGIGYQLHEEDGWGYGRLVHSGDEFINRYEDLLRFLHDHPEFRGFCLTQLSDVQQEINGLVSEKRETKIDKHSIKKLHDTFPLNF